MEKWKRFVPGKRAVFFSLFLFAIAGIGIFGFGQGAYAAPDFLTDVGGRVVQVIGLIVSLILQLVGKLMVLIIYVMMAAASYNDFIYSSAVAKGWSIVRDICNMFFVLVLLAIAAGTILQQEKYHYAKLLPKFILMAILINFSKTICGLLIDFAQVVMMTFVSAFVAAGPGNFIGMMGAANLLKMNPGEVGTHAAEILISFLLALIYAFIALVVIAVITLQFIIRIVALWFLVILSPFAFILSTLPQGEKYSSKWWDQFTNYVILGPVLAFFLWLSLAVAQGASKEDPNDPNSPIEKDASKMKMHRELGQKEWPGDNGKDGIYLGSSDAGTVPGVAGFILSIVMLLASLVAAQQLASVGGSIAGSAMSGMKNIGMGAAKAPFQFGGRAAAGAARAGAGAAKKAGSSAVNFAKGVPGMFKPKEGGADKGKKPSAQRPPLATGGAAGMAGAKATQTGTKAAPTAPVASFAARAKQAASAVGTGAVKTVASVANTDWKAMGTEGKKKAGEAKEAAKTKMQAGVTAAKDKAASVGKGIKDIATTDVGAAAKTGAQKTGETVKAGVGAVVQGVKTAATGVKDAVAKPIEGAKKIAGETEGLFGFTKGKQDKGSTMDISQASHENIQEAKRRDAKSNAQEKGPEDVKKDVAKEIKDYAEGKRKTPQPLGEPQPPKSAELEDLKAMAEETLKGDRKQTQKPHMTLTPMGGMAVPKEKNIQAVENDIDREIKDYAAGKRKTSQSPKSEEFEDFRKAMAEKTLEEGKQQTKKPDLRLPPPMSGNGSQPQSARPTPLPAQEKSLKEVEKDIQEKIQKHGATLTAPIAQEKSPVEINRDIHQEMQKHAEKLTSTQPQTAAEQKKPERHALEMPEGWELKGSQKRKVAPVVGFMAPPLKPTSPSAEQGTPVEKPAEKPPEKPLGVQIAEMNKAYDAVRMEPYSPSQSARLEKIHVRRQELEGQMTERYKKSGAEEKETEKTARPQGTAGSSEKPERSERLRSSGFMPEAPKPTDAAAGIKDSGKVNVEELRAGRITTGELEVGGLKMRTGAVPTEGARSGESPSSGGGSRGGGGEERSETRERFTERRSTAPGATGGGASASGTAASSSGASSEKGGGGTAAQTPRETGATQDTASKGPSDVDKKLNTLNQQQKTILQDTTISDTERTNRLKNLHRTQDELYGKKGQGKDS